MLDIRIVIGIFAILHSTNGACPDCIGAYNAADTSNVTLTCNAVKTYVNCLEEKLNNASCEPEVSIAEGIQGDLGACDLSEACTCQKDFFKAVTSCSTAKARISCLKGKMDEACDETTNVTTLTTTTETYINGVGSCPLSGTTCECEVAYAKADISSNAKKCTALKNEISCLVGKTGNACDGSTTVTSLAATIADNINGTGTGCNVTETCQCQIDFTKASVTTANKCSSAKLYSACIGNVNSPTELGCDEVTQQDAIKTTSSAIQREFCSASGLQVASILLVLPAALFFL